MYFISVLFVNCTSSIFTSLFPFLLSALLTRCFQMSLKSDLESAGWYLSQEGIDQCSQGLVNPTVKDIIKKVVIVKRKGENDVFIVPGP